MLGDPIARRERALEQLIEFGDDWYEDDKPDLYDDLPFLDALTDAERKKARTQLLRWATTSDEWWATADGRQAHLRTDLLHVARHLGMPEVADALKQNPHMVPLLFQCETDCYEEWTPCVVHAEDFIRAWSRLLPDAFLARVLLAIADLETVGLAEVPSPRARGYDVGVAVSIAWKRCRAAGVG